MDTEQVKDHYFFIERYIRQNGITSVILKVPEPCRSSHALDELTKALMCLCKRENVKVSTCTINELKVFCGVENKAGLMQSAVIHYPELTYMLNKAQKVKKIYYVKIFEAALAAKL